MSKYFLVTWGAGYQAPPRAVSQDELQKDDHSLWSGGDYAEWDAHMEKLNAIDVSETIVLADNVSPDNSCEVSFTRITKKKFMDFMFGEEFMESDDKGSLKVYGVGE